MMMHKDLTQERWCKFSLMEQMANVGCDVDRAIRWRNRGEPEYSRQAFERALELFDLTIRDPKNKRRRREVGRAREAFVDHFLYNNENYNTTDEQWQKYFFQFGWAAAMQRGR